MIKNKKKTASLRLHTYSTKVMIIMTPFPIRMHMIKLTALWCAFSGCE